MKIMKKKKNLRVGLRHKNTKIFFNAEKAEGLKQIFGLMFIKKEKAAPLLFEFKDKKIISLHSFFVFFPFLAIWLDDKDEILETRLVKPFSFCISPKKPFTKVLEIPFNQKYKKIAQKFVGKRKI